MTAGRVLKGGGLGEVLNIDCFQGPKAAEWLAKARGLSIGSDGWGMLNGGIVNPQREHMKVGQIYYRFVSKSIPHGYKVGGMWWMDYETLKNIHERFRQAGANPHVKYQGKTEDKSARSTFREWLALTYDWNEIEEVIVGELRARVDAYTGFGRLASGPAGKHAGDTRAFGYAPHLSKLFSIKQWFVPEFFKYNASAMPNAKIHDFDRIDDIVAGTLV